MIDVQLIDRLLLSQVTLRWQKAAMVIGSAMLEHEQDLSDVDDRFLTERIKALLDSGKIEARGDLNQIRYSEVRLPQSPSP